MPHLWPTVLTYQYNLKLKLFFRQSDKWVTQHVGKNLGSKSLTHDYRTISLGILGKDPSHDGNTPEKEFNHKQTTSNWPK